MKIRTALAGLLLLGAACKQTAPPPAAPDLPPGVPPGLAGLPPAREIKPVYAAEPDGPPDPLAQRLCQALHEAPEARRAACCQASPGVQLGADCVRTLSSSLRSGAIRLVAVEVEACVAAFARSLEGCDWIGPFPPPLPPACAGLFHGTLAAGARCRSTLECAGELRCRGTGPTELGVCGPPGQPGERCGTGVDTLAAFTRQESIERTRRECEGACARTHQCVAATAIGGACVSSLQCGPAGRCAGGKCAPGAVAALGEACTGGDCGEGLRCHKGRCIAPARGGAACVTDFECRGGCVSKVCAPRCDLR